VQANKTTVGNIIFQQEAYSDDSFLLQKGFLKRTLRGREVTEKAYKHFGIEPTGKNAKKQSEMFE